MIDLQHRQGSTWKKLPPIDLPHEDGLQHYIIAYGNGAFGSSMKGKKPGPTKKIFRHLCHLARFRNIQVSVLKIDEYLTLQICATCDLRSLVKIKKRRGAGGHAGPQVHAVLKCKNCSTVWNRDELAAKKYATFFSTWPSTTIGDLPILNGQRTMKKIS